MKRLAIFLASVLIAFSLISCSKEQVDPVNSKSHETTVETTVEPTPTPTPSPTPTPVPTLVKAIEYEVIGSDRVKVGEIEYDSNGNVTKEIKDVDDAVTERTWTYDSEGNQIAATVNYKLKDGSYESYDEYTYVKNNIVESYKYEYTTEWGSSSLERLPVYDENNKLVGQEGTRIYDSSYGHEEEISKVKYTFDDQDRLIEECFLSDSSETTITYTYDEQGRLLTKVCPGEFGYSFSYTYSESGRLMTTIHQHSDLDGAFNKKTYTDTTKNEYDDKGLLVKTTERHECYSDGTDYTDLITYEYDEFDNLTKTVTVTWENGFEETIIYEFENEYE